MSIKTNSISIPDELPVIPLKNVVLFPRVAIPLLVQRTKSLGSLDAEQIKNKLAVFIAQKNIYGDITENDIFLTGTVGRIFEVHKLPDGSSKIDVEGIARVKIKNFTQKDPFFKANIEQLQTIVADNLETHAITRATIENFKKLVEIRNAPAIIPDLMNVLHQIKDPFQVVYLIAINLNLELTDQQEILETSDAFIALKKMNAYVSRELEIIDAEKRVVRETRKNLGKMQKEVFLREQMKSIEKELGMDGEKGEFDQLREKIKSAGMPTEVEAKAMKELGRLEKMPSFSPEISYVRTYLDLLVELPWSKKSGGSI